MKLKSRRSLENQRDRVWEADAFARKSPADKLLSLLRDSDGGLAIRLEAPYGSGKSYFLSGLACEAGNAGFIVVQFNAWEEEILSDPLSGLGSAVLESLSEDQPAEKLSKIQNSFSSIISGAALAAASDIPFAGKAIQRIEQIGRERIAAARKQRGELRSIRDQLHVAASVKKVLILVDEIDRCRPDYALRVIETLKHIFEVRGIASIVATDRASLHSIIAHTYGSGIEPEAYLRKIFAYTFRLPSPKPSDVLTSFLGECQLLEDQSGPLSRRDHHDVCEVIESLSSVIDLTLRDVESVVLYLKILLDGNSIRPEQARIIVFIFSVWISGLGDIAQMRLGFSDSDYLTLLRRLFPNEALVIYFLCMGASAEFAMNTPLSGVHAQTRRDGLLQHVSQVYGEPPLDFLRMVFLEVTSFQTK